MPVRDLSHLPRAGAAPSTGWAPDAESRFIGALVEKWSDERTTYEPRAKLWTSAAGKCSRALGYAVARVPESDAMDLTGVWNTRLGSLIHDLWQEAMREKYGDDIEIESRFVVDGISCRIDAIITIPQVGDPSTPTDLLDADELPAEDDYRPARRIAYELKTCGGYAFKAAVGKIRKGTPAEGPKFEHVAQGALNADAAECDEMVIGYLAKEAISVNVGKGMRDLDRISAEWTLERDEFQPIAAAERARMTAIIALHDDEGLIPARKFPGGMLPAGAEIVDPTTGRYEVRDGEKLIDTGSWWACGYCNHRTLCAQTPAGRISVETPVLLEAKACGICGQQPGDEIHAGPADTEGLHLYERVEAVA